MNTKLAETIDKSGLSRAGLARRVVDLAARHRVVRKYSHIDVGRWIEGVQPQGIIPALIAEVLAAKLGHPVTPTDIGLTGGVDAALASAGEYPATVEDAVAAVQALVGADRGDGLVTGPQTIEAAAWSELMLQWLLAPDQAPAARTVVGAPSVDGLLIAMDTFTRLDHRFGGGYAHTALVELLRAELAPLVADPHMHSPEVLSTAAALLRLVGWTAYDTGDHPMARNYFAQGLRLAQAAGDRALGGRIMACMSHQANFLGHHSYAVNLARTAQKGATGHATPTAMALFHAMEARALAGLGDRRGVETALAAAEKWFEQRALENDPAWLQYFDRAELAAEFAHSYRDLGVADKAIEYGKIAVYDADPAYARSISFCQCVLAAGHLGAGEIEEGLRLAGLAVDRISGLRSARARAYVADFELRLVPFRADPAVAEFLGRPRTVAA